MLISYLPVKDNPGVAYGEQDHGWRPAAPQGVRRGAGGIGDDVWVSPYPPSATGTPVESPCALNRVNADRLWAESVPLFADVVTAHR
jgi:hypothetical protein